MKIGESSINPRILVIAPSISQPRFHKRVSGLIGAGYEVTVYAFSRGYFEVNHFPNGLNVVNLGPIRNGSYLSRLPRLLQAARKIWACERLKEIPTFTYSFGFDCLCVAQMLRGRNTLHTRHIYEVGDIRTADGRGLSLNRLAYAVEMRLIRRTSLLVVTAEGFLESFYRKYFPEIPSIVIENKLPKELRQISPLHAQNRLSEPKDARIRIGFVGFLRYPRTFIPLLEEVAKRPDAFELLVYGDGHLRPVVEAFSSRFENINFHGAFKNPGDLPAIYEQLDLNYVVYDSGDLNVKLAIPNKLYESMFFRVPIAVAEGTALAKRVREWETGVVVDIEQEDFASALLDGLSSERLGVLSENCARIDVDTLFDVQDELQEYLQRTARAV